MPLSYHNLYIPWCNNEVFLLSHVSPTLLKYNFAWTAQGDCLGSQGCLMRVYRIEQILCLVAEHLYS